MNTKSSLLSAVAAVLLSSLFVGSAVLPGSVAVAATAPISAHA